MRLPKTSIIALALLLSGRWLFAAEPPGFVEREAYLMGTRVRMAVWAGSRGDGHLQLERALQVLEQADAELSTWRDDSAVSAVNSAPLGVPWPMDRSLCALFGVLEEWRDATGSAFDPAIGSLIAAWDIHGAGRIPTSVDLEHARAASGFEHLVIERAGCRVTRRADVKIDVGAFGKGEALDRAARTLGELAWMIDLGGQISVGAPPPGEQGWRVSIAHPRHRSTPHLDVRITAGSLSTSAGSERDLTIDGHRVGHILDPRTGTPARFAGSVSVWHPSGLAADILSTALYVMGPSEGLTWAESRGIAACYLELTAAGQVHSATTASFRRLLVANATTLPKPLPAPGRR